MPIKRTKNPKSKSAKYYQTHPEAKAKKKAYDTKRQSTETQKRKKRERARLRYRLEKKLGKTSLKGKDLAHTKKGIKLKPMSVNRGSKTDQAGDRRARQPKKKKNGKKKTKK